MQFNKIITISAITSSIVLGASSPVVNSGNIDRQLIQPKDIPTYQKPNVEIQGIDSTKKVKDFDETKKVFIKDFTFKGNTKISSDELKAVINDYINKELTFKQINEVMALLNKLYTDKGYFVSRTYLSPQDIVKNNNILEISILEGNYGEFKLKNNSLVNDKILQDIVDNVKDENIININSIDRVAYLINDRAGSVLTKTVVGPGQKIGTSDFDIEVEKSKRVDGYVVTDNYGSRYTGYNRLQGLVNINSPFNIGDKISISGLVSNGTNLKNGRLAYELPLNSYGLKSDFAYTRTNYNLVKEYKDLDAKGNSSIYEAGLSYPIIRTTNESLYLKGKYYNKDMNDYMSNDKYEDKSINSFVTTLEYDKNYNIGTVPAHVNTNVNLTTGYLNSKNNNLTNGKYNKVDAYISNDIYFNEILSLNTSLIAQKVLGHKNLDGSEDLTLGGPYAIKVYPYSEQSAENGYIASNELFSNLPSIGKYEHKVGVFYNIGDVYQEKNTDATFERKRLKDIGVGYYSIFKDFFLKSQMAWTANSEPISSEDTNHENSKFLIQAGWVF